MQPRKEGGGKEIVPDPCSGSKPLPGGQSFRRLRYNARQEKRKEINQIGEGRVEGLL